MQVHIKNKNKKGEFYHVSRAPPTLVSKGKKEKKRKENGESFFILIRTKEIK